MTKAAPKYRSASPRRHRAASCLVACSALLISAALIAISLLLPPINLPDRLLARQYSPLNADAPTIALEGELRLSLPPGEASTNYAVKLERLTALDSTANSTANSTATPTIPSGSPPPARSCRISLSWSAQFI